MKLLEYNSKMRKDFWGIIAKVNIMEIYFFHKL